MKRKYQRFTRYFLLNCIMCKEQFEGSHPCIKYCKKCRKKQNVINTKRCHDKNKEKYLEYVRKWNKEHPEKCCVNMKRWRTKDPERAARVDRKKRYKREYNITLEDYDKILEQQKGCCPICGDHFSKFQRRFHIDHDHRTGKFRGILCGRCNIGLGSFSDNPELLEKAALYLRKNVGAIE